MELACGKASHLDKKKTKKQKKTALVMTGDSMLYKLGKQDTKEKDCQTSSKKEWNSPSKFLLNRKVSQIF